MSLITRPWFPITLSASDVSKIHEGVQETEAQCDSKWVALFTERLDRLVWDSLPAIYESDHLSVVSHFICGWGNPRVNGGGLSDVIADHVHYRSLSRPFIFQCHPEGDVHPWQTFAYLLLGGVAPTQSVGRLSVSFEALARESNRFGTTKAEELGHFLLAISFFDFAEDRSFRVSLLDDAFDVEGAIKRAIHAHYFGDYNVCRKFHLTEGLCAIARRGPFERYAPVAQSFLLGQLDILVILAAAYAIRPQPGGAAFFDHICRKLAIGDLLVNHFFYVGHLLELLGIAKLLRYEIEPAHRKAAKYLSEQLSWLGARHLEQFQIPLDIYQLGHFRRGYSLIEVQRPDAPQDWTAMRHLLEEFTVDAATEFSERSSRLEVADQEGQACSDWCRFDTPEPPMVPILEQTASVFNQVNTLGVKALGRHAHFRRIHIEGWPRMVHYEFLADSGGVLVELHVESPRLHVLLPRILETTASEFPCISKEMTNIEQRDFGHAVGFGRLDPGLSPAALSNRMETFIAATKTVVDRFMPVFY